MHRVFFDSNEGTRKSGFLLHLDLSLIDLDKIGDDLKDGLRVMLYMPEELEMEAELVFDHEHNCWKAIAS